jgi:hypothetical protein
MKNAEYWSLGVPIPGILHSAFRILHSPFAPGWLGGRMRDAWGWLAVGLWLALGSHEGRMRVLRWCRAGGSLVALMWP